MKDYSSAFLGLILAGVVMLVVGLGLMVKPGNGLPRPIAAESEKPMQEMQDQASSARLTASDPIGTVSRASR